MPAQARRVGVTRRPACRFCPDRDATAGGLCVRHTASRQYARKVGGFAFDEVVWAARQRPLPGVGPCVVPACPGRAELPPALCPRHRLAWQTGGSPRRRRTAAVASTGPRRTARGGRRWADLPPLLEAEIRYGLWAHTKSAAPAKWPPDVPAHPGPFLPGGGSELAAGARPPRPRLDKAARRR